MQKIMEGNTKLVIIQATPFCNISCRYCYLPNRLSMKRMDDKILSRIFEVLFSSSLLSDHISIVWHAGEPLTLPTTFYEKAFQIAEQFNKHDIHVTHCFQTNGTLINQAWCDFIKRHDVHVGVSLDGPKHIHDASRIDRAGKGTFDRALHGLTLLQQNDIYPSIIMVLTRTALAYPDEIWQFFTEHGLTRLAFNSEEIEGVHTSSSLRDSDTLTQYKRFFARLLELRDMCENPPFVRELDTLITKLTFANTPIHSQLSTPLAILSFDCEGNVSTFSPELLTMTDPDSGNFIFGNVFDGTLEELPLSQKLVDIHALIQKGVSRCEQTCQYFTYCGGGAPSNKLYENKTFDSTETMYCKLGKQVLTDVVVDYLESKYGLPPGFSLSIMERVWRIQDQIKSMHSIIGLKNTYNNIIREKMFDDWNDLHWDKIS
jgi:uncharacterized protein